MRLVLTWLYKTVLGAIMGAGIALAVMFIIITLIMSTYAQNDPSAEAASAQVVVLASKLALLLGAIIGGVRGGRFCMRPATRERIENIIRQHYPNDTTVTQRAGRAWFRWCCGWPMLKIVAGESDNTERVCLHCQRYETYDIVRLSIFEGTDVWGWRHIH